jgi:hypothetical protein
VDSNQEAKRPPLSTTYGSRTTKQDSGGNRTTIIDIQERTVRSYSEDTIRTASKPEPPKVKGVFIAAAIDTSKGSATSALPSARKGVIQGILKDSSATPSKVLAEPSKTPRGVPVRSMSDDKHVSFATTTQFDHNDSEEEVIVTDLRDLDRDEKVPRKSQDYRPRQDARRPSIQSDSSLVDPDRLKERFAPLEDRRERNRDDDIRSREGQREREAEDDRHRHRGRDRDYGRSGAPEPAHSRRTSSRSSVGSRGSAGSRGSERDRPSSKGSQDGGRVRTGRVRAPEREPERDTQLTLRSGVDSSHRRSANDNFEKIDLLVVREQRRGSVDSKHLSERDLQAIKDAQNLSIAYRGTGCDPNLGTCSIFLNTELVYLGDDVGRDRYLDRVIVRSKIRIPRSQGENVGSLSHDLARVIRRISDDIQHSMETTKLSSSLPSASRLEALMGRWDRSWGTNTPQDCYPFLFGLQCQVMQRTLNDYTALDHRSDQKPKPVLISAREWKSGEFELGNRRGNESGSGRGRAAVRSRDLDPERQVFRFCHAEHSDRLGHSIFVSAHNNATQCLEPGDEQIDLPDVDFDVFKYGYRTINSRYAGRTTWSQAAEGQRACGSSRHEGIRGDSRR